MDRDTLIKYPRRNTIRSILKRLAKFFVFLLLNVKISGQENLPKAGPYIAIGNHVSALDPILMLVVIPDQLEFIGTGDIPIDPRMSVFTKLYGFIPIMRGQIDQKGLNSALSILEQNGVLGIFPEGGIWEKNIKEPKLGTSWIWYKSKVSIIPIGFIGMNGALLKALRFKKPTVRINIGKPISFDSLFQTGDSLKSLMVKSSQIIMGRLVELLPEEEINNPNQHVPRNLKFIVKENSNDTLREINIKNQYDLNELIEHPVIMDVFKRNLKLTVTPLMTRNKFVPVEKVLDSLQQISDYLNQNPGFLSYRFGIDKAINMKDGIGNLFSILKKECYIKDLISINIREN